MTPFISVPYIINIWLIRCLCNPLIMLFPIIELGKCASLTLIIYPCVSHPDTHLLASKRFHVRKNIELIHNLLNTFNPACSWPSFFSGDLTYDLRLKQHWIYRNHNKDNNEYSITIKVVILRSDASLANDTPYLAHTNELWGLLRYLSSKNDHGIGRLHCNAYDSTMSHPTNNHKDIPQLVSI